MSDKHFTSNHPIILSPQDQEDIMNIIDQIGVSVCVYIGVKRILQKAPAVQGDIETIGGDTEREYVRIKKQLSNSAYGDTTNNR